MRASRELADRLADKDAVPVSAIVAHSHGGNVAVHAVWRLRARSAPPVRVVTLATPFLLASPRKMPMPVAMFAGLGHLILAAFGPAILAVAVIDGPGSLGWPGVVLLVIASFLLPWVVILGLLQWAVTSSRRLAPRLMPMPAPVGTAAGSTGIPGPGWRVGLGRYGIFGRRRRAAFIAAVNAPEVNGSNLLVMRAAGDEASAVLVSGQFVGWLTTRALAFARPAFLVNALGVLGVIGFVVLRLFDRDQGDLVLAAVYAIMAILYVLSILAYVGPAVGSLAYGPDGPASSLFALVTAESTPPGRVEVDQRHSVVRPLGAGLAHSSLYDDRRAIVTIRDYLVSDGTGLGQAGGVPGDSRSHQ
jgi:hypothetical protein